MASCVGTYSSNAMLVRGNRQTTTLCVTTSLFIHSKVKTLALSLQGGLRDKVRTVYENFELNSFSILYFINKRENRYAISTLKLFFLTKFPWPKVTIYSRHLPRPSHLITLMGWFTQRATACPAQAVSC